MVHYRSFRNDDPPRLVEVWNDAFNGRGAVRLKHSSPLDNYLLSKPYFDREGLLLAFDEEKCVGFAHAGFGANKTETALDREHGVTCLLGVRPAYRRKGIGSELLHRCEAYLTRGGATSLYAGPLRPLNPFYLGLYGGSELPGFLASDATAEPFFTRHGYKVDDSAGVFHRHLVKPIAPDGRFAAIRNQYEVVVTQKVGITSWWHECVLGPVELIEFRLEEKGTNKAAAWARAWEMEGFSWRWNLPSVGLVDVEVREDARRKGLAKFLIGQILLYLQDQFFGLVEVQARQSNHAGIGLLKSLGFDQADTGRLYKK